MTNLEEEAKQFKKSRSRKRTEPTKSDVVTKRDFFAGHALSGLLVNNPLEHDRTDVIRQAWETADQMIESE